MNMIDEVVDEDDSDKSAKGYLHSENASSNLSMIDEISEWHVVEDRSEKAKKRTATINLKDITESDFLELIDSKNQDKRFFGWLNFQPLFQEFDADRFGNPLVESDLQNKKAKEFSRKQDTDYSNIDDFVFNMFDVKMDE
jgi:hypothetical protein